MIRWHISSLEWVRERASCMRVNQSSTQRLSLFVLPLHGFDAPWNKLRGATMLLWGAIVVYHAQVANRARKRHPTSVKLEQACRQTFSPLRNMFSLLMGMMLVSLYQILAVSAGRESGSGIEAG